MDEGVHSYTLNGATTPQQLHKINGQIATFEGHNGQVAEQVRLVLKWARLGVAARVEEIRAMIPEDARPASDAPAVDVSNAFALCAMESAAYLEKAGHDQIMPIAEAAYYIAVQAAHIFINGGGNKPMPL